MTIISPYALINSMRTVNQWQASINANLVGATKIGYKEMDVMFGGGSTSTIVPQRGNQLGVALAEDTVRVGNTYINFRQGELINSPGNFTNLAIDGDGFFVMSTKLPTAADNFEQSSGDLVYTRNGEFFRDQDGLWRNNEGFYLLANRSIYNNTGTLPLTNSFTEVTWPPAFNTYNYRQHFSVTNLDTRTMDGTRLNGGPVNGIGDSSNVKLRLANSQINADFSDIRVLYDDSALGDGSSWVELGRNVIEENNDGTYRDLSISFKLYNNLAGGATDNRYYIFHGDPSATLGTGFPNDPSAGALYADNFNQYAVGNTLSTPPYSIGPISPTAWGINDVWESRLINPTDTDRELVHVSNSTASNPLQEAFVFNGTNNFTDYRFTMTAGKFIDDGRTVNTANNPNSGTFYDNDEFYFYFRHGSRGENYRVWVAGSGGPFHQSGTDHAGFSVGIDKLYLKDPGAGLTAANIGIASLYRSNGFNAGNNAAMEFRVEIEANGDDFQFNIVDNAGASFSSPVITDNGIDFDGAQILDNFGNVVAPYLTGGIGLGLHSQASYYDDMLIEDLNPKKTTTQVLSMNGVMKADQFVENYLNLANFPNLQGLRYYGNGGVFFEQTDSSGFAELFDEGLFSSIGRVRSGYLETSNVNMARNLTNLTGVKSMSDVIAKQFSTFIAQVDIGINLIV